MRGKPATRTEQSRGGRARQGRASIVRSTRRAAAKVQTLQRGAREREGERRGGRRRRRRDNKNILALSLLSLSFLSSSDGFHCAMITKDKKTLCRSLPSTVIHCAKHSPLKKSSTEVAPFSRSSQGEAYSGSFIRRRSSRVRFSVGATYRPTPSNAFSVA